MRHRCSGDAVDLGKDKAVKYWTNAVAPLRAQPDIKTAKILEIPPNALVECYEDHDGFLHVEYKGKFGYVANTLAEPYWETLPKNCVEIPNQVEGGFEQYFMLDGVKQVNFCGELDICYALDVKLESFIETMKVQAPKLWKRLKGSGRFSGTTDQDLIQMCAALGVEAEYLSVVTKDRWLNRSRYTPAILKKLTETGFPIVACKIDGVTGRLRGSGIGHWVLVTKVEPERTGGLVYLYNSAPNRIEVYSWQEFVASANQPYGVFIRRSNV